MIIGLCGYGRSGKDTLAQALVWEHGFTRYAFADKVRALALQVDPWVEIPYAGFRRLAYVVADLGWEGAKAFPDVRQALQHIGDGARETIHEDVWVDALRRQVGMEAPGNAVITDVRYPNEANWVESLGVLVRVTRPGVGPVNGHKSETLLDEWPAWEFTNGGSVEDLRRRAPQLLEVAASW